jgi:hypothetical protein
MDQRRAAVGIDPFAVHVARHAPPEETRRDRQT